MKVIFMGTPEFAVPAFKKILNSKHLITAVFTQKPRKKGRNFILTPSPIQKLAEQNNIPCYCPISLKSLEIKKIINSIEADIIVVVAYGLIIPIEIIDLKKHGCLNIHPSKLPKYRGASPLQYTIINGDPNTAVCLIKMNAGIDSGDIILEQNISLDINTITLPKLHDMCSELGSNLLLKALDNINYLPAYKQVTHGVSYTKKLVKSDGKINWDNTAFVIDCLVRAMNPWPGAFFYYQGKTIKVLQSSYSMIHHNYLPGQLIAKDNFVACRKGVIFLKTIQPQGKSKMSLQDFLRGIYHNKNYDIIFT